MPQNNSDNISIEILDTFKALSTNERVIGDIEKQFRAVKFDQKDYDRAKSIIEKHSRDSPNADFLIKEISTSKKWAFFYLIKYLDNNNKNNVNIDSILGINNYNKKIPEGVIYAGIYSMSHLIIVLALYTINFDCSKIAFSFNKKLLPDYLLYLKFIYITMVQFIVRD